MSKKIAKISNSIEETREIAQFFLENLFKGKKQKNGALVVGLSGDLGAGKTAFTQGIAHHLGIKNKITSPTFVIVKKYPIKKLENYKFLFHIDAYRLKNEGDLLQLGWEEIIKSKEHLVLIEWPENVSKVVPGHARYVYISTDENGQRIFELK